jgi:hypothetical protein
MKKASLLLFGFFVIVCSVEAQEIVRSTVGVTGTSSSINTAEKTYVIQESVGQSSVIGKFQNEGILLRQGFIQPPLKITNVLIDVSDLDAVVYPNPFTSEINIVFNEDVKSPITILIYDVLGKVVYNSEQQPSREIKINLDFLSSAQYLLHISSNTKQFKANLLKN